MPTANRCLRSMTLFGTRRRLRQWNALFDAFEAAQKRQAEEAREAGRKGGVKVSQNREHMSEIGRKGGERRSVS